MNQRPCNSDLICKIISMYHHVAVLSVYKCLAVLPPPPSVQHRNSGKMVETLINSVCEVAKGLGMCGLHVTIANKIQICPKILVHDCKIEQISALKL